ncbi:MAG: hypothetical protein WD407_07385, partial [Rhodospirillales bacterium]
MRHRQIISLVGPVPGDGIERADRIASARKKEGFRARSDQDLSETSLVPINPVNPIYINNVEPIHRVVGSLLWP